MVVWLLSIAALHSLFTPPVYFETKRHANKEVTSSGVTR